MASRIPPTEQRSRSNWTLPSRDSTGFNPIALPITLPIGNPADIEAFAKKQREDSKNAARWENDGGKIKV
jgi:hypothetical protein